MASAYVGGVQNVSPGSICSIVGGDPSSRFQMMVSASPLRASASSATTRLLVVATTRRLRTPWCGMPM